MILHHKKGNFSEDGWNATNRINIYYKFSRVNPGPPLQYVTHDWWPIAHSQKLEGNQNLKLCHWSQFNIVIKPSKWSFAWFLK